MLAALYALDGTQASLDRAQERAAQVVRSFAEIFTPEEHASVALFSGPGRTEIGGNHTDHQHGHVLCGSVDLDMLACAAPNGKEVIRIHSQGYPTLEVELSSLLQGAGTEYLRGPGPRGGCQGCGVGLPAVRL